MTPPDRPQRHALRWGLDGVCPCALAVVLALAGIATAAEAREEGSVDDVMMQVVEDPDADEREYAQDIAPPGTDRASDSRDRGANGDRGRDAATAREAAQAAGEARDAAQDAREAAGEARDAAQDARNAAPPDEAADAAQDARNAAPPDEAADAAPDDAGRPD